MNKIQSFLKLSSSYFFIVAMIYVFLLIIREISLIEYLFSFLEAVRPLWIGALLSFFIYPFMNCNQSKVSFVRALLVYLVFVFIFIFFFMIFLYLLIVNMDSILYFINHIVSKLIGFIKNYQLEKYIYNFELQSLLFDGYEWFLPFIKNILNFISTFIFSVIISFCITLESHILINRFKSYVSNYKIYFKVYDIFSTILKKYIYSTSLDILYIIITTTLILFLFKTPYALLLSILLAFFNIFPYVGAIIGNGLLIIIHLLLVKDNTILLFIIILINSQIESHIIHTWICNKTMQIHPLFLFIALLVSQYFFGILGIILSPIFASIMQLSLLTYSEYLSQRNVGGWEKIIS